MADCRQCADFEWCAEHEDCGLFKPKQKQTHYDRLISKSPEELARFVCNGCPPVDMCFRVNEYETPNCVECWLDYLKQEAKE